MFRSGLRGIEFQSYRCTSIEPYISDVEYNPGSMNDLPLGLQERVFCHVVAYFHMRSESYSVISYTGDVVAITAMGQPTLILGSVKAANDLLDAKGECQYLSVRAAAPTHSSKMPPSISLCAVLAGAIYSDRPYAVMAGELLVISFI